MSTWDDYEKYLDYAEAFDPIQRDRQARRKRKPKASHTPKKSRHEIVTDLTEEMFELEGGFETTYQPSKYESTWLLQSLQTFYHQLLITDVEALIKGGKEANVYRCKAHPSTGVEWLAAKVYRPHMFRTIRNDAVYRAGRSILTDTGMAIKENEGRVMRAVGKKSAFGRQVSHTSWLMYEYLTLKNLYAAGAAVPHPYVADDNAILMSYIGDQQLAAPPLSEVALADGEAQKLFRIVLSHIELMLEHDFVHGDLSAYNILYWKGYITLIDFPQVVNLHKNDQAYDILERDITRICEYFDQQGVTCDPPAITDRMWKQYGTPLIPPYEDVWADDDDDLDDE